MVAEWPARRRRELAERLSYPVLTENTITTAEAFLAELDRVGEQGYAVDRGEHEDFIHCIAAPVHGARGEVVAAISLSVPEVLLDRDGLLALVDDLLGAARRVSAELDWPDTQRVSSTKGKIDDQDRDQHQ